MPELPEVEALAAFLTQRAVGHVIATVWPVAINVLKTYDPPPNSLAGLEITSVQRRGKFLDLDVSGLHLVTHLARAGWLQWKEKQPEAPPRPGKGPLALRVILDDGSGFDLTEAGTQKRLAVYVVKDPFEVPGIARLGIDPLDPQFTPATLAGLLGKRQQVKGVLTDQSVLAGVGNAYSDEVLWVARMSPFKPASNVSPEEVDLLYNALVTTLRGGPADVAAPEVAGRDRGQACRTLRFVPRESGPHRAERAASQIFRARRC
jgi:formamidopyrimidine-DNA glycosylase